MSERPVTRVIAGSIGPNQRTVLDVRASQRPAPPVHTMPPPAIARGPAPDQNTLIDGVPLSLVQHTARALYGTASATRDARVLAPDHITMVDGVPAPVVRESPSLRMPPVPQAAPSPAPRTTSPRPTVWVSRRQAIALAVVASLASALLAGGIVHALHERSATAVSPEGPHVKRPRCD
jgi:hypothetical protein